MPPWTKSPFFRSSAWKFFVGYIDALNRHRRLCIRPIRRLPLRPPAIRTIKQHRASHQPNPLIQSILPLRRLRRRRQLRHLRPHRARPHPLTNPAPRSSTPIQWPHRLCSQTLRSRRCFSRFVSRRSGDCDERSASVRGVVSRVRVYDECGCRAQ